MLELKRYIIEFLKVLSDLTRLEILNLLKDSKKTSLEIQNSLNKSQSTISQHLKILYNNKLIDFEKKKKIKYYYVKNTEIFRILDAIKSFVIKINRENLKDFVDIDIIDILF
ncbi:MAG: ArsR/SmtB family transcription factor [Promethearchaeota archaeon]